MDEPATKQDLHESERRLRQDVRSQHDELIEAMRDMQTEVLRAFHT